MSDNHRVYRTIKQAIVSRRTEKQYCANADHPGSVGEWHCAGQELPTAYDCLQFTR
jgi:hypothetical protein